MERNKSEQTRERRKEEREKGSETKLGDRERCSLAQGPSSDRRERGWRACVLAPGEAGDGDV